MGKQNGMIRLIGVVGDRTKDGFWRKKNVCISKQDHGAFDIKKNRREYSGTWKRLPFGSQVLPLHCCGRNK